MYELRRWWDRFGIPFTLATLGLGTALLIRQSQAGFVMETYQWLTRPFQSKPVAMDRLMNAQTRELQQRLIELESKNQKLEELLGFAKSKKAEGIPASVIGRSADHWWQHVTLSRGSNDGVKEGAVVMSPGGLVGRIIDVSPSTSRVLLLSDPSSRVGVAISRSRFMGYLRGKTGNRAVMEFFEKVPDVRKDDVVTTSSFSQLFPAGIPIGRVESVDLTKSPAPEATIELTAPINYLEWAMIYPHSPALADPQPAAKPNLVPSPSASPDPSVSPSPDASLTVSPTPEALPSSTP
ncbi:rod shape-determining protein MreC [Leptolyngbya boryana NIES-2135]|jgi:rod shape-determining protein MreC|uniref:Cell shape-determining protein MreC n=1 Tax=Leptolyngbya boryana NIES-2135 TaxID=1973484 RepID=A0A1Z4JG68_LEPBY|nr:MULTISPECIES: rod shape-determining protein MreC [Leptolyngbya]BAY55749.1 rod shape-determining protein MreC [Leptolyngbya boryana NIES-2135]MBD2370357.1 rod shape-determining protein MreC [Leptolyngbya sp. FACHB-161]MBD2376701.1 rod shape-determining protein MreC [Leptolyngbya sp. FACHB-238]MBD2400971.1 rod shape-determining protein MreC [Leptolyngbya sp. FACHB-239]MBD2407619.1 rod shape-determining protein MreC [Leptolyngbya sp. FACHB-402]